jgi:hypothetical protein
MFNSSVRNEQDCLKASYEKRIACWEIVGETMMSAIATGKGSRKRRELVSGLRCSLKLYNSEEEEYRAINKFGRGFWRKDIVESFNKDEQKMIIEIIAEQFGAFDY